MTFGDQGTEDIYNGISSPQARRTLPVELWKKAQDKLDMLNAAHSIKDLMAPPGNHLEKLSGDLQGHWSIRINDRYRIVFRWEEGRGASDVRILDYH